jgi:hypothetical protein
MNVIRLIVPRGAKVKGHLLRLRRWLPRLVSPVQCDVGQRARLEEETQILAAFISIRSEVAGRDGFVPGPSELHLGPLSFLLELHVEFSFFKAHLDLDPSPDTQEGLRGVVGAGGVTCRIGLAGGAVAESGLAVGVGTILVGGTVILARDAGGAFDVTCGEARGWGLASLFAVLFGVPGAPGRILDTFSLGTDVANEALVRGEEVIAMPTEFMLILALATKSAVVKDSRGRATPATEWSGKA